MQANGHAVEIKIIKFKYSSREKTMRKLFLICVAIFIALGHFTTAFATESTAVECVQRELLAADYDPNGIDNKIGRGTRKASEAFRAFVDNKPNTRAKLSKLTTDNSAHWCRVLTAYNKGAKFLNFCPADHLEYFINAPDYVEINNKKFPKTLVGTWSKPGKKPWMETMIVVRIGEDGKPFLIHANSSGFCWPEYETGKDGIVLSLPDENAIDNEFENSIHFSGKAADDGPRIITQLTYGDEGDKSVFAGFIRDRKYLYTGIFEFIK